MLKPREEDDFFIRRSLAMGSAASIMVILVLILGIVFIGDTEMSERLTAAQGILMTIITALIGNVSFYMHQAHSSKDD